MISNVLYANKIFNSICKEKETACLRKKCQQLSRIRIPVSRGEPQEDSKSQFDLEG